MLRLDDLEVYLRIRLMEYKKTRTIGRLMINAGWMPISKGPEIWQQSRYKMIDVANNLQIEDEYDII